MYFVASMTVLKHCQRSSVRGGDPRSNQPFPWMMTHKSPFLLCRATSPAVYSDMLVDRQTPLNMVAFRGQ